RSTQVDGRVDRAMGSRSSESVPVYTIDMLNIRLRQYNPDAYERLPASVPLNANPRPNPYNPRPNPPAADLQTLTPAKRAQGAQLNIWTSHWTIDDEGGDQAFPNEGEKGGPSGNDGD